MEMKFGKKKEGKIKFSFYYFLSRTDLGFMIIIYQPIRYILKDEITEAKRKLNRPVTHSCT